MRLIKKIFYTICVILICLCAGVMICAFNPNLTDSLSEKLYAGKAEQQPTDEEMVLPLEEGQASETPQPDQGMPVPEQESSQPESEPSRPVPGLGSIGAVIPEYIAPSGEDMELPDKVTGLAGYEPMQEEALQLTDVDARRLQESLKVGVTGESFEFDELTYPYYAMLNDSQKELYRQVYAHALDVDSSFAPIVSVQSGTLKNVMEAVYNDHPELFWLETAYTCKYTRNGQCLEITLQYNQTIDDLDKSKKAFEQKAKEIVEPAKQLAGLAEQEKYVHDVLSKRVEYNAKAKMGQSAYSALVNGESVCAGYARAFQYVMQQLGVPCYYCTGYAGEDHAWNIIKIEDSFYNVDVTWDDTQPASYDFYNKTDADYASTHVRKSLSVYLPACNGDAAQGTENDVAQEGDSLSGYINDDPQEPMRWPDDRYVSKFEEKDEEEIKRENLKKAGITEDEVLDTMTEYYKDCLDQLVKKGSGYKDFSNVVPKSLWSSVEQAYGSDAYKAGYVTETLKKLKMENFVIQIQVDDLSGGYYRIYHYVSTW